MSFESIVYQVTNQIDFNYLLALELHFSPEVPPFPVVIIPGYVTIKYVPPPLVN